MNDRRVAATESATRERDPVVWSLLLGAPDSTAGLQRWLYAALRAAIVAGRLPPRPCCRARGRSRNNTDSRGAGIDAAPLSKYTQRQRYDPALVMGFAAFNEDEMDRAARQVAASLRKTI
jgi:hypothetical protein